MTVSWLMKSWHFEQYLMMKSCQCEVDNILLLLIWKVDNCEVDNTLLIKDSCKKAVIKTSAGV